MSEHRFIWYDQQLSRLDEPQFHINAVALKYGAQVFEGIRGYRLASGSGLNLFALQAHVERLIQSARLMRMDNPYDAKSITNAIVATVRANELNEDCYIRAALSVVGTGGLACCGPVALSVDAFPQGRKAYDNGVSVAVNGWMRLDDAQMPPRIKCVANYQNGRLALLQALQDGYDNVILTDRDGKLVEAPTATLFICRGGKLITPPVCEGILESITREFLIEGARELGLPVLERKIDRTELYPGLCIKKGRPCLTH